MTVLSGTTWWTKSSSPLERLSRGRFRLIGHDQSTKQKEARHVAAHPPEGGGLHAFHTKGAADAMDGCRNTDATNSETIRA